MTNLFTSKTNFSAGELTQDLLGRVDLSSYDNGALSLKNVFVQPTGGIYRRPGLKYVDTLSQKSRLIVFEKSTNETYLIVLQDLKTVIYQNDMIVSSLETPWTENQINAVRWCQGSDALYLTHPEIPPQKIVLKNSEWSVIPFSFLVQDDCILQPYHKYCDDGITLSSTAVTGDVTVTASGDVFQDKHVGCQFKIGEGYVQIKAISDTKTATATVLKKLVSTAEDTDKLSPTRSWGEPAFDTEYGWPITVAFYQSRLVFGGSKRLPNRIWFSQSGDLTNFELGEGYDSESIEFNILSDQDNTICALFSGRHLQVFTTNAEWMVSGEPLTPTNIQLKRQTQVGSPNYRFIPPIGIDGATIFPSANGFEIREFLFADIEQAYQATDLSLMAGHLISKPQDQAYDKHNRQAYIIMEDGRLCILTSFRAEDIQSWTEQVTDGQFLSVTVCGQNVYFTVLRNGSYYLEKLSDDIYTDCGFLFVSQEPKTVFSGLSVLEGRTVKIVADDVVQSSQIVSDGQIILDYPAKKVEVGLAYTHQVVPLPPSVGSGTGRAPISSARLVKATFRVIDTASFEIDTGTGLHQEIIRSMSSYLLDKPLSAKTSDIVVRALGWIRSPTEPLWYIQGDTPKPFKLVSVTSDIQIGG